MIEAALVTALAVAVVLVLGLIRPTIDTYQATASIRRMQAAAVHRSDPAPPLRTNDGRQHGENSNRSDRGGGIGDRVPSGPNHDEHG